MPAPLTIGQVAKITGMTAKTIRYYEAIGIVPAPRRSNSGYRHYDGTGVDRLRFVRRARSLGLPLRGLKTLTGVLNGTTPHRPLRPRLFALVREQLTSVEKRIAELDLLRRQLRLVSRRMRGGTRVRRPGPCRCLDAENIGQRVLKRRDSSRERARREP